MSYKCTTHPPDEHGECCKHTRRAYEQGRADERAAIVAWLREDGPSIWCNVHMTRAERIERGEHLPKEEP